MNKKIIFLPLYLFTFLPSYLFIACQSKTEVQPVSKPTDTLAVNHGDRFMIGSQTTIKQPVPVIGEDSPHSQRDDQEWQDEHFISSYMHISFALFLIF